MDIYVNGTKIDFQLEQEKTLGDVLTSLTAWGENQKYVFTGYSLNEGAFRYGGNPDEVGQYPLDEVQLLETTFQSTFEYAYETVRDIQFHIYEIYKKILSGQAIDKSSTVVPWMRESVKKLVDIYNGQDSKCMETITTLGIFLLKRESGILSDQEEKSLLKTCVDSMHQIDRCKLTGHIYYMEEILRGENVTEDFLEKILVLVDALRCELFDIGENIAKGNDKDAMLDLQNFMHGCSILVLYTQHCKGMEVGGEEIADIFEEPLRSMTEILKKVEIALKESDLVCIADSLEYEIYEHIEELLKKISEVVHL